MDGMMCTVDGPEELRLSYVMILILTTSIGNCQLRAPSQPLYSYKTVTADSFKAIFFLIQTFLP